MKEKTHPKEQCIANGELENIIMSEKTKQLYQRFDELGLSSEERVAELKKAYTKDH